MPTIPQRPRPTGGRPGRWIVLLLAAAAAGCGDERGGGAGDLPASGSEPVAAPPAVEAPPPAADPPEPGTAEAAVTVLVDYYSAIARRDFARAWALWAGGGAASGQSFEDFRAGYADTESVSVEIGAPGRIEPAAGSRYVRIPVEIAARLADGSEQCFTGTYTLRRAVVDGATAEQRSWRLDSADVEPCVAAAEGPPRQPGDVLAATRAAASLVERFGERLERVSLLAPEPDLAESIRREYGPLVTPELLAAWLADPASAPGREVSSPWPDRIEVGAVTRRDDGAYTVTGDVVSISSADQGEDGAARREAVALTVVAGDDGVWRIAAYERR